MKQELQRCDGVRTARGVASKISPAKSQTNRNPLRVKQKQLVWYFWIFCGTAVKSFLRRASAGVFINVLFFMLVLVRLFNSCKYECRYFVTFLLFLIFVFSQQKVKNKQKYFVFVGRSGVTLCWSSELGIISCSKIFMDIYADF